MTKHLIGCAVAVFLVSTAAHAQTAPDPSESTAKVPSALYRSVFQDTPTGVETAGEDWKKANATVGQFLRGHIDVLKWEEQNNAREPMMEKKPLPPGGVANPVRSGQAPAANPSTPDAKAPAHKH